MAHLQCSKALSAALQPSHADLPVDGGGSLAGEKGGALFSWFHIYIYNILIISHCCDSSGHFPVSRFSPDCI